MAMKSCFIRYSSSVPLAPESLLVRHRLVIEVCLDYLVVCDLYVLRRSRDVLEVLLNHGLAFATMTRAAVVVEDDVVDVYAVTDMAKNGPYSLLLSPVL